MIPASKLENLKTIGSEYYLPNYVETQNALRSSGRRVWTLEEITSTITDGDHGSADYQEAGVAFILSENVKEGWIDTRDLRYISREYHHTLPRSRLRPGDVLVTKTGVYFGRSTVVPDNFIEANTIAHVGIIRLKAGVDAAYVSTFLNSKFGYSQLRRRGIKATRPEIKLIELRGIEIVFVSAELEGCIRHTLDAAVSHRHACRDCLAKAEQILTLALGLANSPAPESLFYSTSAASVGAAGRLDAQYYMPAKAQVIEELAALPGATLGRVYNSVREMVDPSKHAALGLVRNFDVTHALEPVLDDDQELVDFVDLGSVKKRMRRGDVAISRLRAYLKEIAVVDCSDAFLALGSSEFIVLRPKARECAIAPATLMTFLRSQPVQTILKWCQDGSQHPRFSEADLLSIPLPDAVATASPRIEGLVADALSARQKSRNLIAAAKRAVEIAIEQDEAAALRFLDEARG